MDWVDRVAVGCWLLVLSLLLGGCAAKRARVLEGHAELGIPVACIDKVKFLEGTKCKTLEKPDYAKCTGDSVVHFTCTAVVKPK